MNISNLSAKAKLILHGIVNIGGNSAIIAVLPTFLPSTAVAIVFLAFNLSQVIYAFTDPSFAVHLIQTGQMAAPAKTTTTTTGVPSDT
jgi:hypothetical protein